MGIPFQRTLPATPALFVFAACVFALNTAGAQDEVLYKWVDKNGVVTYSQNKPPAGQGQDVSTFSVPETPQDQQRATKRALQNLDQREDANYQAHKRRQMAADARIDAAATRLQQAEQRLAAGSQVQAGDRVGNADGYTRLRDSYFARVARLQAAVDQAKKDLDNAYTARDQL
jgi:hypothetical protein